MAVPVEMAFSMPSFLWEEREECSGSGSSGLAGQKPKHIDRGEELQSFFKDEIVKLIPDFLDIVKSSKKARKLGWFAAYGLHGSHDAAAADRLLGSKGFGRPMAPRPPTGLPPIDGNSLLLLCVYDVCIQFWSPRR